MIAGGPHPTSYQEEIKAEAGGVISHFLSGEVEHIFEVFLRIWCRDCRRGVWGPRTATSVQTDITVTPVPRYDLINLQYYGGMTVQFSRGCPFDCECCDITKLFGRVPRTKTNGQFLAEFDLLYQLGWRGSIFVVDDNFIGNKRDAMRLLPLSRPGKKHTTTRSNSRPKPVSIWWTSPACSKPWPRLVLP